MTFCNVFLRPFSACHLQHFLCAWMPPTAFSLCPASPVSVVLIYWIRERGGLLVALTHPVTLAGCAITSCGVTIFYSGSLDQCSFALSMTYIFHTHTHMHRHTHRDAPNTHTHTHTQLPPPVGAAQKQMPAHKKAVYNAASKVDTGRGPRQAADQKQPASFPLGSRWVRVCEY